MKRVAFSVTMIVMSAAVSIDAASAQNEISAIPFDSIPSGTRVVGGGASIGLEGDTHVSGALASEGVVSTETGFQFPDATVQTTAAAGASTTSNSGLYANTIPDSLPPNAYTEICIKAGGVSFDIHSGSESTAGGNCLPGDVGWVIERFERDSGALVTWYEARLECLKDGMRLPEPFEWRVTCDDAATFAVSDMEDLWEWSTNSGLPEVFSAGVGAVTVTVMGNGSCAFGGAGQASTNSGGAANYEYRCAK